MSDEIDYEDDDESSVPSVIPTGEISFLIDPKQDPLYKTHAMLEKQMKKAVSTLVELMETSPDEKIKASAAKDLINFKVQVAESMKKDQLARLMAESRKHLAAMPRQMKSIRSDDGEEESSRPNVIFDPNHIQNLSNVDNL